MSQAKQRQRAAKKAAPKKTPRIADEPKNGKLDEELKTRDEALTEALKDVEESPKAESEKVDEAQAAYDRCHGTIQAALIEGNFRIHTWITQKWVGKGQHEVLSEAQWTLLPNEQG